MRAPARVASGAFARDPPTRPVFPPDRGTNPRSARDRCGANSSDGGSAGANFFRRGAGGSPGAPAVCFTSTTFAALFLAVADLGTLRSADRHTHSALTETTALAGRLVFDLLAEAAGELTALAGARIILSPGAQESIDALLAAAESLADVAIADAVVAGDDARRIGRAQDTVDAAVLEEARQRFEQAIVTFGIARREAALAVR